MTTPDGSSQGHWWPSFLPDERHFLYFNFGPQPEEVGIYVASLDGHERKRLVSANASAMYTAAGYLIFLREETVMAQPFDPVKRRLTGEPFRLIEQLHGSNLTDETAFSVSANGVLVYGSQGSSERYQLQWFDRKGNKLGVVGSPGAYSPRLSPDERRVAVVRNDLRTRNSDIWLHDLARPTGSRFTVDPATDATPIWSPDGSRIVWNSNREGLANLYQKLSSGAGEEELLLKADNWKWPNDWSADGRFIVYAGNNPKTNIDLWILPLDGERKPFPYLQNPFIERDAAFSPDSKWIAYCSDESGIKEVYVQAFPRTGEKWPISSSGGTYPSWRRDGKELFYLNPDGKLMAVEVKSGARFETGVPTPLFDLGKIRRFGDDTYAVTGDGKRFLMVTSLAETSSVPFTVVLNWTAELKR